MIVFHDISLILHQVQYSKFHFGFPLEHVRSAPESLHKVVDEGRCSRSGELMTFESEKK